MRVYHRQCWFVYSQHVLAAHGARALPCHKLRWTPWSEWSACSLPCGHGTKKRQRMCEPPGRCQGSSIEQRSCNLGACASTEWSDWGSCAASCYRSASGGVVEGSQSRARNCVHPTDGGGGCRGMTTDQSRTCSKACPIRCPTTNSSQDCSGHGNCMITPDEGCSQRAICRCDESLFVILGKESGWLVVYVWWPA